MLNLRSINATFTTYTRTKMPVNKKKKREEIKIMAKLISLYGSAANVAAELGLSDQLFACYRWGHRDVPAWLLGYLRRRELLDSVDIESYLLEVYDEEKLKQVQDRYHRSARKKDLKRTGDDLK
jgi:hypothetical protein